jgi:hypothetical protein
MSDEPKADVAICVLGKPFQTALTIASLLRQSGPRIGRIFIQEEPKQPFGEVVKYLFLAFPGADVVQFTPRVAIGLEFFDAHRFSQDADYRAGVRYQRAWEEGREEFLFISHNDCIFTGDVVGKMIEAAAPGFIGVGQIGQCWNCPASFAQKCSGPTHEQFNPTYEEAIKIVRDFPGPRTPEWSIQKDIPSPFPECRLNEFACLIHRNAIRHRIMPEGPIEPLGAMTGDTGTTWFRKLRLEGYRFKDFQECFVHAPFSPSGGGRAGSESPSLYSEQEEMARAILRESYPEIATRLDDLRRVTRLVANLAMDI